MRSQNSIASVKRLTSRATVFTATPNSHSASEGLRPSKITAGIELAKLVDEGKVNPNDPVTKYIPELKGSAWDTVSVIDTANMATGLNATEHDEPEADSRTNPEQPWYQTRSSPSADNYTALEQMRLRPSSFAW
ncbi:hypothetical protein BCU83_16610 [Vibrio breoganii]|uniref:Beta-lactamase-related domain-containing protein n=1 Tax=Vibrio breoganii TaxID=553239 RepID=A0AAN0XYG8_9VIBR|nr:hypothetical protein A6E01_17465 [Vibrio breoganii]OEF87653.1 hypothetical protein B003_14815 [Vibrio breoganii 1C10]PMF87538.1 hypothetical protein BCV08_12860 [Vibrio breoganii]PMG05074.1 hypothetical protein BCV02_04955 [Vibrio breoganii]PMG76432.1 hypothetical protein BCU83_16610 [Vibrio breoganii]